MLLLAQPPPGMSWEYLLGLAVCAALRCPAPACLAPLFSAAPADTAVTLAHLRVAAPVLRGATSTPGDDMPFIIWGPPTRVPPTGHDHYWPLLTTTGHY